MATDTVEWSEELFHLNGRDSKLPAPSFAEMSSCYTPESWKRLSETVAKTLHSGESYELDLEIVQPDGTTRYTSARGEAEYDAGGKVVRLHGSGHHRTEADGGGADGRAQPAAHVDRQYARFHLRQGCPEPLRRCQPVGIMSDGPYHQVDGSSTRRYGAWESASHWRARSCPYMPGDCGRKAMASRDRGRSSPSRSLWLQGLAGR